MNPLSPYMFWIKLAGAALLAIALAAGAWWITATYFRLQISDMEKLQALAIIIAQDKAAHQQEDADKITYAINTAAVEARARQLQQIIANLQKVAQYVSPETDRAFPLPCGFLRLHDAAANGIDAAAVSLPTGKADTDKCDVKASAAAGIIQDNYGLALGWKAERDSWWQWYVKQKASWDAYRASAKKEN